MDKVRELWPTTFSGLGQSGEGTLKVEGKVVDTKTMKKTPPAIQQWDEAFDIGSDTLTGVDNEDYRPPFALTSKLDKLTVKMDRLELSAADIETLKVAMAKAAAAREQPSEPAIDFPSCLALGERRRRPTSSVD